MDQEIGLGEGSIRKVSLALLSILLLSACGAKPKGNSNQFRNLTERQTGHIIEIKPGQESLLEKNFPGAVRVIDANRRIYEILPPYTKTDIEKVLSETEVIENVTTKPKLPVEDLSPKFIPCVSDPEPPRPEISVLNESELKGKGDSLNRGQVLRLSAQASESHPNHPSKLSFAWKVLFPDELEPRGPFSYDANFDVQLNDLGVYQIGVTIQDTRGVCAQYVVQVGVTDNPKLVKNAEQNLLPLSKLDDDFAHLQAMNAPKAWPLSQGKGQKVAIIDSGVNYNHPYLSENIAINEKEIPDNDIDDDKNGRIDDVYGWDFVQDDAQPFDDIGHGSHVAGLAAGKVFGLAQEAKILPIKAMGLDGRGDLGLLLSGIYYAVDRGATVINMSLGFPETKDPRLEAFFRKAFAYAESKGVVIVTAAGNRTSDIDVHPHLPAALDILNNISVAATDMLGKLTSYSNFGIKSVKVAAPGGDDDKLIFSANKEASEGKLFMGSAGTSMAAPLVSGAVSLARAANPKMSIKELNDILLTSGTASPALSGMVKSGRVLDAFTLVSKSLDLSSR